MMCFDKNRIMPIVNHVMVDINKASHSGYR